MLRRRNFYAEGQETPYGQPVRHAERAGAAWDQVLTTGDVAARSQEIAGFNATHPHTKRALAMTPVKFGISFNLTAFNQAGALVHVYKDGSVLINHGGTEMGQGLHTKMLQVAATSLGVPLSRVRLAPTRTDKVPNTSATAASSGSDLNGAAIKNACEQITARLVEVDDGRDLPWEELVRAAYFARVPLFAAGYYRTEGLHWDATVFRGTPFKYFAYGVAAAEVEVDGFTGSYRTRRVDIVHDVGDSLSPLVDLGQIEGGFVQGAGWLTLEDLRWDESDGEHRGRLTTQAASTYKLPSFSEMPEDFRVAMLEQAHEDGAVYGSKAVGEPPLMLAFAVREALRQACAAFGPAGISVELPARRRPRRSTGLSTPRASRARARAGGCLVMRWLQAVERLRAERRPGVLVTVVSSPGPRAAARPARRWSWPTTRPGTPSAAATSRPRRSRALASSCRPGPRRRARSCSTSRTRRPGEHGVQCCGGEVTVLLEPLGVRPAVAVFGVGHVGLELARILARHDLDLHLVDSRTDQLGDDVLAPLGDADAPPCTCTTRRCCPSWCSPSCPRVPTCW